MKIYQQRQAEVLFKHWPEKIDWFIVGGPANAYEAQTVVNNFPDVKCVGFEPVQEFIEMQESLNFPGELYDYALWDENCTLEMPILKEKLNSSSLCRGINTSYRRTVKGRTLDSLSEELGPFTNSVLWLDIEGAELKALHGANYILDNHVKLINVECMSKDNRIQINNFIRDFNFRKLEVWNASMKGKCDIVFGKV